MLVYREGAYILKESIYLLLFKLNYYLIESIEYDIKVYNDIKIYNDIKSRTILNLERYQI